MNRVQQTGMKSAVEGRPLIGVIEERNAVIAARCQAVEEACQAIGFEADSGHELIARLVAKAAGRDPLVRSIAAIAEDRDVGISYSYARRCLRELSEFGVVTIVDAPASPTKRRGRPAAMYSVTLNWDFVYETIATDRKHQTSLKNQPAKTMPVDAAELVTDGCRISDGTMTAGCRDDDETMTAECPERIYTLSPTHYPNTHGPISHPSRIGQDEDQKDFSRFAVTLVDRGSIEPTCVRLCESLRWPDGNVRTLWHVAAAFDAGLIDERSIADAARAAVLLATRNRVGYFRRTLAEKCGTDPPGLSQMIKAVQMRGGFPTGPPSRRGQLKINAEVHARIKSIPVERDRRSDAAMNDRRNQVLRELEMLS